METGSDTSDQHTTDEARSPMLTRHAMHRICDGIENYSWQSPNTRSRTVADRSTNPQSHYKKEYIYIYVYISVME